jgi:LysM repeat protein
MSNRLILARKSAPGKGRREGVGSILIDSPPKANYSVDYHHVKNLLHDFTEPPLMSRPTRLLTTFAILAALLAFALPSFAQGQTHTVQPGENLFRIALSYGLTTAELAAANNIANTGQIYSGQVLVIPAPGSVVAPAPSADPAAPAAPAAPVLTTTTHTVVRGEKLGDIARRYGMTLADLISLNNIANPNLIYAGQILQVNTTAAPAPRVDPAAPAAPVVQTTTHVVQRGEYLSQIAVRYGVSWVAIAQANNIATPDRVYAGMTLIIPAPGTINAVASTTLGNTVAPAAPIGTGREILVDLSDSMIYAYENGVLMRSTLASMGRAATPTVIGSFTVQRKYVTSDMSGPGYYLSGVPYAMYFYQGYAIHGTYWHSNWGVPMSRGCVNLPPGEAEWYFNFAPIGTPVRVQA